MPVVNQDATSNKWWPSASSQWASLLGGRLTALPSPSMAYGCQDLATPLVDDFGGDNMTATGTTFRQTASGWLRKAWQLADGTATFALTSGSYGGASQSTMSIALQSFAIPVVIRTAQYANNIEIDVDTAGKLIIKTGGGTGTATSANVYGGTGIFPLVVRNNITAVYERLNTPSEQVACGATANGAGSFFYGGASAQSVLSQYVGIAQWTGTNAEYTDAMVGMLIDSINNGPAVTSIALSLPSFTVNPTATQQLNATATRFDASTYTATSTVTWTSSNPSVATVSVSGLVTGVAPGTATITASFTSLGASTASVTSACTVSGSAPTVPLPVIGTDVPDHIAQALARLPEQDKNKPSIAALLSSFVSPAQDLESALWQLLTQRFATTAIGSNLDAIGKLVGQPRNGLADVDYRTYIYARISANRSSGLAEDLLRVAKLLINNAAAVITLSYGGPGTAILRVTGVTQTDAQGAALAAFVQTAIAAGIRVLVIYSMVIATQTFRYDVGPGYDVGHFATGIG